ncbi:MAG: VOC family protein [Gemmatimonadales bacterium]
MTQLHAYLSFNGNCREAFELYQKVLRGKIESSFTFGETPGSEQVPADARDRIMHTTLKVGDQVIMGSDMPPGQPYEAPRGIYVSINVDETAEAERIFRELSEGGQVVLPIDKTFWAERFGMTVDRFGTPWMVNCAGVMANV